MLRLYKERLRRQQLRNLSQTRSANLRLEELQPRLVLSAGSFAGNDCPPDLDLSGLPAQIVPLGQTLTIDLLASGATATDEDSTGAATGDVLRFQLDPDVGTDVPAGVSITDSGVLTWTPTADQLGEQSIMILLLDAGTPVLADAEELVVTVTDAIANTAPVLDLNGNEAGDGFQTSFTSGSGEISIVGVTEPNALTLTDAENSTINSAEIRIQNISDVGSEILDVDVAGTPISKLFIATTGVLELSGDASVADYQAVLRTLTYNDSQPTVTAGTRTVEITVSDGLDSNTALSTIDVQQAQVPNQAPQLAAIADQTVTVNQLMQVTVTATDPNSGDTLTIELDADNSPSSAFIDQTNNTTAVVQWTPTEADGVGPFTIRVIVTDDGSPALADQEVFTVNVQFPPAVDLNGDAAGGDFAAVFNEGDGPTAIVAAGLTVTDLDSSTLDLANVKIENLADGDDEVLDVDTTGTSIVSSYDPVSGELTLSGNDDSVADFEQVLRTLVYQNMADEPTPGDRSIVVTVSDGDLTSDPVTSTVSVVGVNDAPMIEAIDDQQAVTGTELVVDVTASDAESGSLTFRLGAGLPAGAVISPAGDTMATIRWTPDSAGDFVFRVEVEDDGNPVQTAFEEFTVTVALGSTAPVVDLNGPDEEGLNATASFVEDAGPVALASPALTISDPLGPDLASATISIGNLVDADAERLDAVVEGTGVTKDYAAGVLTLTGQATLATYETILESLTYDYDSDNPTIAVRMVNVLVNNGSEDSAVATVSVSVTTANDSPFVVSIDHPAATVGQELLIEVELGDPEGDDVTITLAGPSPSGTTIEYSGSIATIHWTPDTAGDFTFLLEATDDGDPAMMVTEEFMVTVEAMPNAAPVVDLNGDDAGIDSTAAEVFVEDSGAVNLFTDVLAVTDVGGADLTAATVTIANLADGTAEVLDVDVDGTPVTKQYDGTLGVLTLTGTASLATYETILETLTYENTSDTPTTTDRSVEVRINDGINESAVATVTVPVSAANDPPEINLNHNGSFGVSGPLSLAITRQLTVVDVDDALLHGAAVVLSDRLNGSDELLHIDTSGTAIEISQNDPVAGILVLGGVDTVANYQEVLRTLEYSNSAANPTPGIRLVQIKVTDETHESETKVTMIEVKPPPDGNDVLSQAEPVTLSVGDSEIIEMGQLENGGDVDFYSVAISAGQTLIATATAGFNPAIRIFDSNAVQVSDDAAISRTAFVAADADATYFVGISADDNTTYHPAITTGRTGTATGLYDVTLSLFESASNDDILPLATAVTLDFDTVERVNGRIDPGSDVDFYAVVLSPNDILHVDVTDAPDDDVLVRIFDAQGNSIGFGNTTSVAATLGADGGTVYVGVSSAELTNYNPFSTAGRAGGSVTDYEISLLRNDSLLAAPLVDAVMASGDM